MRKEIDMQRALASGGTASTMNGRPTNNNLQQCDTSTDSWPEIDAFDAFDLPDTHQHKPDSN